MEALKSEHMTTESRFKDVKSKLKEERLALKTAQANNETLRDSLDEEKQARTRAEQCMDCTLAHTL
jgi:phage regulator Rha-like protein